jgi:hypothetical protein
MIRYANFFVLCIDTFFSHLMAMKTPMTEVNSSGADSADAMKVAPATSDRGAFLLFLARAYIAGGLNSGLDRGVGA